MQCRSLAGKWNYFSLDLRRKACAHEPGPLVSGRPIDWLHILQSWASYSSWITVQSSCLVYFAKDGQCNWRIQIITVFWLLNITFPSVRIERRGRSQARGMGIRGGPMWVLELSWSCSVLQAYTAGAYTAGTYTAGANTAGASRNCLLKWGN